MTDLVLVKHDNGLVSPMSAAFAKGRGLTTVEGETRDATGRPVRATTASGRKPKPKTSVAKAAAKKAVTPDEGAADTTLTNNKE